jgi:hypothetical protein
MPFLPTAIERLTPTASRELSAAARYGAALNARRIGTGACTIATVLQSGLVDIAHF